MDKTAFKYLVIENAPDVCKGIEERMQQFSMWEPLSYCVSPRDAIEKLTIERPQLIFIDWSLNGGSAYEVLDHIKNMKDYDPYIIFNTGYQKDNPEIPQVIFNNYNIDKYIVKPIWENLRQHLNKYLAEAVQKIEKSHVNGRAVWLENHKGHKVLIYLSNVICVTQHPHIKHLKNIYTVNPSAELSVSIQWSMLFEILKQRGIDFFVTKNRAHLVAKNHIHSFERPFVRIRNFNKFKIEVSRDNLKNFEDWLLQE